MSTLDQALELLEFKSIDDVTAETLKQSFKSVVIKTHPDRGGNPEMFDQILSAYSYLSKVIKRLSGGRDNKQTILVSDVKESRESQFVNELNNLVNDIFDHLHQSDTDLFNKKFNEEFEKHHVRENERGYESWLRSTEDEKETSILQPPPNFKEAELNTLFEERVRNGKPAPTSIILHPDEMSYSSGRSLGSALIQKTCESFTSDPDSNPEYTDLQSAYTNDNTLIDKLPVYVETKKSLEDILAEREQVYQIHIDHELEAISAYEKKKLEEEKLHKKQIAEYFKTNESSRWALSSGIVREHTSLSDDSFVIHLSNKNSE